MRRFVLRSLFATALLAAPAARAQDDFDLDDDDFTFEGDEPEQDDGQRLEGPDDLDAADDESDESLEEFFDPDEADEDLLGDEGEPSASDSGDTPALYRETLDRVKGLPPDEEIQEWEQYLQTWPNTPFRDRISKRIAELESQMYQSDIIEDRGPVDAMQQEIHFSQALLLENIDPRTRLQLGAEWGLPDYINLFADYEHQIVRKFSVHAGVRRRYSGYSLETGARWAVVKSTRTRTLVTGIVDFHYNANPAWPGLRPQLALGKRFGDALDAQILAGADLQLYAFDSGMPVWIIGGASATYRASDIVRIFLETGWNMRALSTANDAYFFRFNTATFGMKFFPKKDRRTQATSDDVEVNMGASVPYSYNYWTYHLGSVMVQSNMYL